VIRASVSTSQAVPVRESWLITDLDGSNNTTGMGSTVPLRSGISVPSCAMPATGTAPPPRTGSCRYVSLHGM